MKCTITIEIDTQGLDSYTDEYLAELWHIAQANPKPFGNKEACELVREIGTEIIRRWLVSMPVPLHHHQAGDHYKVTLRDHGKWIDGVWRPNTSSEGVTA